MHRTSQGAALPAAAQRLLGVIEQVAADNPSVRISVVDFLYSHRFGIKTVRTALPGWKGSA
jgi:hypothetical protein